MTKADAAAAMATTPAQFFGYSQTRMFSTPRLELETLQLRALQQRFHDLRDRLPVLKKMADGNNIAEIDRLEDIVPLLFKHTIYKSYPSSLLASNQFDKLTKWLGKLTTVDVSRIDVSHCDSIDSWLRAMDEQTSLRIAHSSGTTGTVSFLPMTADDYRRKVSYWPLTFLQKFGEPSDYDGSILNIEVIKFDYRSSYRSGGRVTDYVAELIAGSEARYHTLYPQRMSSDLLYLAGKIRAAQAAGSLDKIDMSPALLARKDEFAALQHMEKELRDNFFTRLGESLRGRRVILYGYSGTVFQMMQSYLASGREMKNLFAPDSIMVSGGGGKGVELPADWQAQLKAFTGVCDIINTYAMSEIMGMHPQCAHGNYHILPSVLPFVLDPGTGESLPRTGRTKGRAAFFDLGADTRWGGFISGDEIAIEWDAPCPCGRIGAHVVGNIERYGANQGGDDKINCAGTPQAQEEALDFLMDLKI